jgi:hypothetical protein
VTSSTSSPSGTRIEDPVVELARRRCAPMGRLDYVIETRRQERTVRTWYVLTPDPLAWRGYAAFGIDVEDGNRVVVDGETLRPLAVLASDPLPDEAPPPCGHNPYFDQLPPASRTV